MNLKLMVFLIGLTIPSLLMAGVSREAALHALNTQFNWSLPIPANSIVFAGGDSSGGGNPHVAEFKYIAREIARHAKKNIPAFRSIDTATFLAYVDRARIIFVGEPIRPKGYPRGLKLGAFTIGSAELIVVNQHTWLSWVSSQKQTVAAHEILVMMGIEDAENTQYSELLYEKPVRIGSRREQPLSPDFIRASHGLYVYAAELANGMDQLSPSTKEYFLSDLQRDINSRVKNDPAKMAHLGPLIMWLDQVRGN